MAGGKPEHYRRPPLHDRTQQGLRLLRSDTAVAQYRDPAPGWAQVAASRTVGDEIGEGDGARVTRTAGVEVDNERSTGGGSQPPAALWPREPRPPVTRWRAQA